MNKNDATTLFIGFLDWKSLKNRVVELVNTRKNTSFMNHLDQTTPYHFIDNMCVWSETTEGSTFWRDVNEQWIKALSTTKINKNPRLIKKGYDHTIKPLKELNFKSIW